MASMIDENESFQDVNGKPIVNGYIYVGVAGQDPKLNPINIYSDRQLNTVIANPQRTDAYGRAVNKIWVPGRYSVKVEDSNNVQKMQDLERGETAGADLTTLTNVQGINNVTAEAEPAITEYVDKSIYMLTTVADNTGAVTLDAGGGAKSVTKNGGVPLIAGDWVQDIVQEVTYNAESDTFEWLNQTTNATDAAIASLTSTVSANYERVNFSAVRQTAHTGPVDANGRASFLVDGGGLSVDTSGLSSTSLFLSYGDGIDIKGEKNIIVEIDSDLEFSGLTDNSVNHLYIDYDTGTGTATPGSVVLPPTYSPAKPSSPSTGQYWYPVDHRSRGEYWNGSSWTPVLRLFVGQVTTASGSVTSVATYAYKGQYAGALGATAASSLYNLTHNIGMDLSQIRFDAFALRPNAGIYNGKIVSPEYSVAYATSGGGGGLTVYSDNKLTIKVSTGASTAYIRTSPTGGDNLSAIEIDDINSVSVVLKRVF